MLILGSVFHSRVFGYPLGVGQQLRRSRGIVPKRRAKVITVAKILEIAATPFVNLCVAIGEVNATSPIVPIARHVN